MWPTGSLGCTYPGKQGLSLGALYAFAKAASGVTIIAAHWGGGLPFYALMPEVRDAIANMYFDTAASHLVYDDQIPFGLREAIYQFLVSRQHVETADQEGPCCERIPAPGGLDKIPREQIELKTELLAERLPNRRAFAQLHLGGGTPTYYTPGQLTDLISHTLRHFRPLPGAELAIEADPRVTSAAHIDALADLGFNRISFGVQDLTPVVQEAIGRTQSLEQTAELVTRARSRGFRGINVDLIYGLPYQTPESFERTVDSVIGLGVDRAAVYSFAFVPWVRGHQKKIEQRQLPPAELKVMLFAIARERFLEAGYEPIGMDHFARPDDELARAKHEGRLRRNFQG